MDLMCDQDAADPTRGFLDRRKRWLTLCALCLGVLMIELDTTIVNVALPSIREELKLSGSGLVWVVNAYMLAFGGFLLAGSRMGDLYGHRRIFLIGISIFTISSLACGIANSQGIFVGARALQGLGGAVVLSVALALITNLFRNPAERVQAIGIYSFVCAAGGSIGLVLGGALTSGLNWHWIFLVNVPIGPIVGALCYSLLPKGGQQIPSRGGLDIGGSLTATGALVLVSYAILQGNEAGWLSGQIVGVLSAASVLVLGFFVIESRVANPLIPMGVFKVRSIVLSNSIGVLWAIAVWTWFFIAALYMQTVLEYTPLEVGLAFLPANLTAAILSIRVSAKLIDCIGVRSSIALGMFLTGIGLALLWHPVDGESANLLPAMVLVGLGAGVAYNPLVLTAVSGVAPNEAGLVSGIFNTTSTLGGALGLATVTSLVTAWTTQLIALGEDAKVALGAGYRAAFLLAAVSAVVGAALSALVPLAKESACSHRPASKVSVAHHVIPPVIDQHTSQERRYAHNRE